MSEPGSRRGRVHDAEGAREAILNAAEEVFAEHGFDGARVDAIAKVAGYNKSLIFQYYGDKLHLYEAVVRRADAEMSGVQSQLYTSLLEEDIVTNAHKFKTLLRTAIGSFFDYMVAHPRFMRIMTWEMAEGWHTFAQIFSERDVEDVHQFRHLLERAQDEGLLRPGIDSMIQILMTTYFFCMCYLACIPLYRMVLPGEDVSSPAALERAREYIVDFVMRGMVIDPTETKP
jgi:TetR/AcrR family transcriptional regulator